MKIYAFTFTPTVKTLRHALSRRRIHALPTHMLRQSSRAIIGRESKTKKHLLAKYLISSARRGLTNSPDACLSRDIPPFRCIDMV